MLSITGMVENAYITNAGTNEKGEAYGGKHKVQLKVRNVLKNGQVKFDIIDLGVADANKYTSQVGKLATIEVGAMVLKGEVHFYTIAEGKVIE